MEYKVGVISGDGIGPEIVTEAKKGLRLVYHGNVVVFVKYIYGNVFFLELCHKLGLIKRDFISGFDVLTALFRRFAVNSHRLLFDKLLDVRARVACFFGKNNIQSPGSNRVKRYLHFRYRGRSPGRSPARFH